jgi:energy-converting hydrogenase Eha subunit A
MTDPIAERRWFHPARDWPIVAMLVFAEELLWLSERFQWFGFNAHKGWTVLIAVAAVGVAFVLMLLWLVVAYVSRWRFQFSIPYLLVLTVVVAFPCSWLAVEIKAAYEQKEVVDAIVGVHGAICYDYESDASRGPARRPQPPAPEWLQNLLGTDFFASVASVDCPNEITEAQMAGLTRLQILRLSDTRITDAALAHLAGLPRLESLGLLRTRVTDAGLAHLAGLTRLESLYISNFPPFLTPITDAGLAHLSGLTRLQILVLSETSITDAGLAHLSGLTQLQILVLSATSITDAGLAQFAGLTQLKELWVVNTQVTDEGVKKLQRALPNCKIFY